MNGKASAVLSFGIKGGIEAGGKFIDKLKLIVIYFFIFKYKI